MKSLVHTLVQKSRFRSPYVVGISGIDGSGKGYITQQLQKEISTAGLSCEAIGIDGWLQPPSLRFSRHNPGEHFYQQGFRFDEMKTHLYDPLYETGWVDLVANHADPTNSEEMVKYHYKVSGPDIIIFEGIFLFQDRFRFDFSIWIECSYETAMQRALARNQEGLPDERIRKDYNDIYFAAQRIHLKRDNPRGRCDFIFLNDDRNQAGVWP